MVEKLWFSGVAVVVSAGNGNGPVYFAPGNDPYAITVGSIEDQDRWMLTPHSALDGDWPALAMQKGNEEAVYRLLLRIKQGN